MRQLITAGALLAHTLTTPSLAQDNSGMAFGIQGGTIGAGAVLAAPLSEVLSIRASYNLLNYDTDLNSNGVRYDAELEKDSLGLLLDWHLAGNGFRLTGGAFTHADNSMSALAIQTAGSYEFNGNAYDASQVGSVQGKVSFEKTTPYFGIGWGNASHGEGFTWTLDLGVQIQDSPSAALMVVNCQLPSSLCAQLDSDLAVEAAQVQQDGEDFDMWPVLNLGLLYHF